MKSGPGPRRYTMRTRADAAATTRHNVVEAARSLFLELPYDEVTLQDVARRAGVSLPTVTRAFGSKSGLLDAVMAIESEYTTERRAARSGDVPGAVRAIVAEYERTGDAALRALAIEGRFPELDRALAHARASHRAWAERTFAPSLRGLRGNRRAIRAAQLATATDVYTWKVLRRDHGLDVAQTVDAITELITALETRA